VAVLDRTPTLDVPGMTELALDEAGASTVGLMPETGIVRLLGEEIDPSRLRGPGRAELYLLVDDPAVFHARALAAGARGLSPLQDRDWGHRAAYSLDPDGHVLAFAGQLRS
jgi:catechol 2,3-dioxygenase-like lactoylglutathione lyase family enzyme